MARSNNITLCSFCGKTAAEVRKLIAGPGVYICDNCITLCKSVLDKELSAESRKMASKISPPKPHEIKAAAGPALHGPGPREEDAGGGGA